jgi:hypothetical protein
MSENGELDDDYFSLLPKGQTIPSAILVFNQLFFNFSPPSLFYS